MGREDFAHRPEDAADSARVAHTSWWDALLAADAVAAESPLAADLALHNLHGTASTKAEFVENLCSGRLSYDFVDGDTALARLHGQTAVVMGQIENLFHWEGQPVREPLYYTAVYGWTPPQWRMLAWQLTIRADVQS